MAGFNLKSVQEREQELMEQVKSYGSKERKDYTYKLLYPQKGTTTVKFLYNPKSGLFKRQIFTHKIGDNKVTCLRTWGLDCALDPIIKKIENVKGKSSATSAMLSGAGRGISLVEFVHSDYTVEGIASGDIVLFMYPWTIFKDLGHIMTQARTEDDLKLLIASNKGLLIDVYRADDNKYSAKASPFALHKTFNLHDQNESENPEKVAEEDRKFEELLNNLESLDTQANAPKEPDEEIYNAIKTAKEYLHSNYLKENTPQRVNDFKEQDSVSLSDMAGGQKTEVKVDEKDIPFNNPQSSETEVASQSSINVSTQSTEGKPECFGKFGTVDKMDACLLCPDEIACGVATS